MFRIHQQINLDRFFDFFDGVLSDLEGTTNGPFRQGLQRAGVAYADLMQSRFIQFSRGGGDWPPLSPETVARRLRRSAVNPKRILKRSRPVSAMNANILFDTQTLYKALSPIYPAVNPGQIIENIPNGMRVGIGGEAIHPATTNVRIGDLARWQHFGTARIPPRNIIVAPSADGQKRIHDEMQSGLDQSVALAQR